MQISEVILLVVTAVVTALSALFCIISLATSSWAGGLGLFCTVCPSSSGGLAVVAFIFLLAAILVHLLFACRILPKSLRLLALFTLFAACIFTLSSYATYFNALTGYSYRLMVVAHVFSYIASLLTVFWLGASYGATIILANEA